MKSRLINELKWVVGSDATFFPKKRQQRGIHWISLWIHLKFCLIIAVQYKRKVPSFSLGTIYYSLSRTSLDRKRNNIWLHSTRTPSNTCSKLSRKQGQKMEKKIKDVSADRKEEIIIWGKCYQTPTKSVPSPGSRREISYRLEHCRQAVHSLNVFYRLQTNVCVFTK